MIDMNIKNIIFPQKETCKKCSKEFSEKQLLESMFVCPECGAYMRIEPKHRIKLICDSKSFNEHDSELKSINVIDFPDYSQKLESAAKQSGETEAVTTGTCEIDSVKCCVFVMNSKFMMGSMGSVVGEKITRLFEYASKNRLPVIGFTASGGARMQEGMYSLMQMAKVSGAVKKFQDEGNLYITVLTDPTTGGVTASFAMEGDIILSEPKALVGFAGARVIKETTGQELPKGFQTAEFMLEHGFIDAIVERKELKATISNILKIHSKSENSSKGGKAI